MIRMSGGIMFAMKKSLKIGNAVISAWIYYDHERDKRERLAFYSPLQDRIDKLSSRTVRKWEKPKDVCADIMGLYGNFISWKYDDSFRVKVRDNAVSQRTNRCSITIITFTGDHPAEYVLSEYRKRDSVEKMLLELHKIRKVMLQDCKEITTELTGKQKEILESFGIRPEHVPTFLEN